MFQVAFDFDFGEYQSKIAQYQKDQYQAVSLLRRRARLDSRGVRAIGQSFDAGSHPIKRSCPRPADDRLFRRSIRV